MGLLYSHFVIQRILTVVITAMLLVSCNRAPVFYAMPLQRSLDLGEGPVGLTAFVTMNDLTADDYIVRDISPGRDHHRWAFLHPEMRFRVKEAGYRKFVMDFAIPPATFKDTGPVTIEIAVEGASLGKVRCDHAGDYLVEKPVPDGLLTPGKDIHVSFAATPRWVSPDDHAELSFFLGSAGFKQ